MLDRLAAQIPGLQLLGELGRGARSVVYRARRGDFVVALKLPSDTVTSTGVASSLTSAMVARIGPTAP